MKHVEKKILIITIGGRKKLIELWGVGEEDTKIKIHPHPLNFIHHVPTYIHTFDLTRQPLALFEHIFAPDFDGT